MPIEEEDIIERVLPNGLLERYLVTDRGYYSEPYPHYQVKASKETSIPKKESISPTVIYQHGNNPRVNINSTDSSTNVVNKVDLGKFEEIEQIIINQISDDQEKTNCLNTLEDLKSSVGKSSYLEKYKRFIDSVAAHISIIAPFIPYLTTLIQ